MSKTSSVNANLLKAMLWSSLACLGMGIVKLGTKEKSTMSSKPALQNDDETIYISWTALTRTLLALFPDADLQISACHTKGMEGCLLVELDDAMEDDYNFFYCLDAQAAFAVEPNLMEHLEFVKAGLQEKSYQHIVSQYERNDMEALMNAEALWDEKEYNRDKGIIEEGEEHFDD